MCVNVVVYVCCSGSEALGPLMGFEDLSDAQFSGQDSVESIEAQVDPQGTLLLVLALVSYRNVLGRFLQASPL